MQTNTLASGIDRLQKVLEAWHERIRRNGEETKPEPCERCEYDECVCGTPEFESWVEAELRRAEDRS